MKNIIIKFIIFILIFFLVDNLLYQALSQLWRKTDFVYSKVIAKKPDIVFFGDSKTRYGIVPDIIRQKTGMSGYNIARYGSGIAYSRGVQSIILSHYRPKFFVIQYMPLSLEREATYSLAPYFGAKELRQMLSSYPYNVKVKFELFKTFRFNSQVLTIFYRLFNNYDSSDGYVPLSGVSGVDRTKNNERSAVNLKPGIGESILKEFIEKSEINNVKVIMLAMPALERDELESYDIYKRIAKEYDIPFLDFVQTDSLSSDDFWDSNHLNDKGAKKFSSLLGEEIKRLLKEDFNEKSKF